MELANGKDKIRKLLANPKTKTVPLIILSLLMMTVAFGQGGGGIDDIDNSYSPPINQTVLELQGNEATHDLVTLHSGEVAFSKTIIDIPSRGLDLVFSLNYRSQVKYNGPFGWNWDSPINQRLEEQGNGDVLYYNGFGRRDLFNKSGSTYNSPNGHYQTLTKNEDGTFTLTNPQGIETNFRSDGRLISMEDTNGNKTTFSYNRDGQLVYITDTLGRHTSLSYYSSGRLWSVIDSAGHTWLFVYTDEGDLWKITSPSTPDSPGGRIEEFSYLSGKGDDDLNHNIKTIYTHARDIYRIFTYGPGDSTDTISQIYFGDTLHATATINYSNPGPGQYVTNVIEPNGDEFELGFNSSFAPTYRTDFTNLNIRQGEGDYTTTHQFNSHGENVRTDFPRGNRIEQTFDESNPDARKRGNLSSYAEISNPTIETKYTYEPRYNRIKTITDPAEYVTTNIYDYEEATMGDLNNDGITSRDNGNIVKTTFPTVEVPVTQPAFETYAYNRYGQLIRSTDARGVKTRYKYFGYGDSRYGYLSDVIRDIGDGQSNIRTRFNVDELGNVICETNPKGVKNTYKRNVLGEILSKTISGGETIYRDRRTYDADGNVIKHEVELRNEITPSDNTWITTEYSYDENYLLTKTSQEISETETAVTTREYDDNMNLLRVTKPEGNKIRYYHDERGLLYTRIDGEGTTDESTQTINYDENGNISQEVSGEGMTTYYDYDDFDRLYKVTKPLGNYTTYTYDSRTNLIKSAGYSAAQQLLSRTDYSYDRRNRSYQIDEVILDENLVNEGTATTLYTYDKGDNLVKVTNPTGNDTDYTYDYDGRIKTIIDPVGNEIDYTYDAEGNRVQEVTTDQNELGGTESKTTNYTYDDLNRLTRVEDNLSNKTNYTYDSCDNLIKTTDPKGDTTKYEYDYQGQKTKTTYDLRDPVSGAITGAVENMFKYDRNGNLEEESDDNSNSTGYQYDAKDRLEERTNADNTIISYEYDDNNRLRILTDENGSVTDYFYDDNDRLYQKDIQPAAGVGGVSQELYQYDDLDRLKRYEDSEGTIQEYKYDSLSHIRKEIEDTREISSSYDYAGRRTSITYPGGASVSLPRTDSGLIDVVQVGASTIADYKYVGLRTKEKDFDNNTVTTYTYDDLHRITRLTHEETTGPATIADFEYDYDPVGNRRYEKRNHEGGKGDVYTYDSLNRLAGVDYEADSPEEGGVNPASGVSYEYDGVGNRIEVVTDGSPETYSMDNTLPDPADEQMNQYTSAGATNYEYDENGNLADDSTNTYTYDYKNRLIEVTRKSDSRDIAYYKYDCLNRRLSKQVWDDDGSSYSTTRFVWDGWQIIEERNVSDAIVAEYVYGRGIDEPLMMERGGQQYYYHTNALGSITHVTNSTGSVVEKYSYDAFGNPTIKDAGDNVIPDSNINNSYMFTGREYDEETGLYYYRNRYYDPSTGRFLSRDLVRDDTLLNLYTYVRNNPVTFVDPAGREISIVARNSEGENRRYTIVGDESTITIRAEKKDSTNVITSEEFTVTGEHTKNIREQLKKLKGFESALELSEYLVEIEDALSQETDEERVEALAKLLNKILTKEVVEKLMVEKIKKKVEQKVKAQIAKKVIKIGRRIGGKVVVKGARVIIRWVPVVGQAIGAAQTGWEIGRAIDKLPTRHPNLTVGKYWERWFANRWSWWYGDDVRVDPITGKTYLLPPGQPDQEPDAYQPYQSGPGPGRLQP